MHIYWRVIEELKFIGETWTFNDPSLARNFERWLFKNSDAIALLEKVERFQTPTLFACNGSAYSLN